MHNLSPFVLCNHAICQSDKSHGVSYETMGAFWMIFHMLDSQQEDALHASPGMAGAVSELCHLVLRVLEADDISSDSDSDVANP